MSWWKLEEKKKQETKSEYLARVKYENMVCKRVNSFMEMVDGNLELNVQYRFVTEQGFNAITVVEYLNRFYTLKEIYVAVYRMNIQSVDRLTEFIDNEKLKCNIILSSFFRENKRYERWCENLTLYARGKENVRISFAWSHAKVFLAQTEDNQFIVFEGSGNLSDNARIEQYLIENNKTTFDFHKQWMDDILNVSI